MPWEPIRDQNTGKVWHINWDGVARIIRAYCRSRSILVYNTVVTEPGGRFGPDIVSVDFDWNAIKMETLYENNRILTDWQHRRNMQSLFGMLLYYRDRTRKNEAAVHEIQAKASKKTQDNIANSLKWLDLEKSGLEDVRDLCFTGVVVAGSVVTGGAGVAMLGGGSFLKGVAKWEDKWIITGKKNDGIGEGFLEASTTMLVGMFDLPVLQKGLSVAEKAALKIVKVSLDSESEGLKTLVEGGSSKEALLKAAARAVTDILGDNLSEKLIKKAIPAVVKIVPVNSVRKTTKLVVGTAVTSVSDQGVKNAGREREPGVHGAHEESGRIDLIQATSFDHSNKYDGLHVLNMQQGSDPQSSDAQFVNATSLRN
ncbi:MAG TPA: hypothetical protein VGO67_05990 [Verrucomicrobiae bacterium]|jgi:hypothetical protein